MKKIALIVLLAVVAARFIHDPEARRRTHRAVRDAPVFAVLLGDSDERQAWTGHTEPSAFNPPPPPPPPAPPERKAREKRRGPREVRSEVVARTEPAADPRAVPGWFPTESNEEALARSDSAGVRVLVGPLSISTPRARADLQKMVKHEVADWLAADVPMTWTPPADLMDRMVLGTYVRSVARNIGPSPVERSEMTDTSAPRGELAELEEVYTFYRAGQRLDFSERRRDAFVERYHRDVASGRMWRLGSIMGVVLAGLAVVSLYVRTDEATRGYYTNHLRVLALGSLTAAGYAAYRYWA